MWTVVHEIMERPIPRVSQKLNWSDLDILSQKLEKRSCLQWSAWQGIFYVEKYLLT